MSASRPNSGQGEGIGAEVDGLNAAVWPGEGGQDGQASPAGAQVEHSCGVASLQGKARRPEQLRDEGARNDGPRV